MTLEIPITLPPSANRLWRVCRGRAVMSPEYSTWLDLNGLAIRMAHYPPVQTPCAVLITVLGGGKGFMRSRDVDNVIKPVCDLIRKCGVIPDDCVKHLPDVRALYVERRNTRAAECVVRIETIQAEDR